MRTAGARESTNVEDRRGRNLKIGALGGGGFLVVLIALFLGVDPSRLLDGGGAPVAGGERVQLSPEDEEKARFVRVVLASTEDVWHQLFQAHGATYREPTLVLFPNVVQSACGVQQAQVGPFYCPADEHVYLDIDFLQRLQQRLGAPGDFAQAYVIAHEVGHHVQNLLGYSDRVHRMHGRVNQEEYNRWSVRLELQADFLAGVWAHHAQKLRDLLEEGDVEEAMNAAAAVGDDKLQRQTSGTVRPESFTHGTSEQRVRAFALGLRTGDLTRAEEFFNQ